MASTTPTSPEAISEATSTGTTDTSPSPSQAELLGAAAILTLPSPEISLRHLQVDKTLTDMIVVNLLPVSIVKDRGFRQFLKVIDQKYTPTSQHTIMRESLSRLYQSKKEELINKMEEISWCSFTTDLWTSNTTMGYITVTCHFINVNWEMESSVLTTAHVPESHTSEYLATELRRIADDSKISTKIHCGITDGASNIKGKVRINQWNNLVCFAHTLNLVVTCATEKINEVREIIDQVKNVVSFFHKSTKASEKLRQIQTTFLL
ncbi:PREDICTED: zinc finger BED domain-containing protein 1-like [Amphimedon queenslandica]|uniref:DUF659 domain-containing protein n=2 Tax=Amphimedon queenslandica TaxID=400682 RepID=A0AAN0IQL5_AMPQE|nr:PREDICTED: zinc finger BED domain-containing protein 1-like [Amphimedon queenslandica]|eukprot:XP_011407087.1 PREDICTED: zinc finger BED domain-containing protein 1-like [Amphimedon queenslandica]